MAIEFAKSPPSPQNKTVAMPKVPAEFVCVINLCCPWIPSFTQLMRAWARAYALARAIARSHALAKARATAMARVPLAKAKAYALATTMPTVSCAA